MTWSHLFKPAAKRDFDAAFHWHEQQETGRGDLFAAEVARAVAVICRQPDLHPAIHRDVRAKRLRVYPYSILYRIRSVKVVILAVHHDRQNPEHWRRRT